MALNFVQEIDLTAYADNPEPKVVEQLVIIHEATNGELVQYYIDPENNLEGDKNTYAIGVPVLDEYNQPQYYEYHEYPEVVWNAPKARITRQRIDRLTVIAFPGVGSIAAYKLSYRNLSQILAPVNFTPGRKKAPTLHATVSQDRRSVTFTFDDPTQEDADGQSITYICYRVIMQMGYHQLEYVTYEKSITVTDFPTSGVYTCYAMGYINEGEVCSLWSNSEDLDLIGVYDVWPVVTPGHNLNYRLVTNGPHLYLVDSLNNYSHSYIGSEEFDIILLSTEWSNHEYSYIMSEDDPNYDKILLQSTVDILSIPVTSTQDLIDNDKFEAAKIYYCGHTDHSVHLYAANVPSENLRVHIRSTFYTTTSWS